MSNHDSPTPPAPAEVCERLREAADALHHEAELSFHIKAMQLHRHAHNITSALLLIEQGEKERERLDLLQERLIPWGDEGGYEINFAASSTDLRKECDEVLAVQKAARAQPTPESK